MLNDQKDLYAISVLATAQTKTDARQLIVRAANSLNGALPIQEGDLLNGSFSDDRGTVTWHTNEPTGIIMAQLAEAVHAMGNYTDAPIKADYHEAWKKLDNLMKL